MNNKRLWILLGGIVILGAAFMLLDFRLAGSNTQSEKNINTTGIGAGLPDAMQRRDKIMIAVVGEGPLVSALQKALAAEIYNSGWVVIEFTQALEPAYQNPVLIVKVDKPELLWTPFFGTSRFSIQAGYASNGDATFMGETPVTVDNKNGPALNMYGEYRVSDRSWGLISRPGYHHILADYVARQIAATLKEIYKTAFSAPAAVQPAAQTPAASPTAQAYWPSGDWRAATPEEQGMDSEMLAGMFQQVEDQRLNLHSLLIVRNGYLVAEAYFHPYTQDQPQFLASVTKSVISALVGIAIQEGYIQDVDQTLVSFFPDRTIANLDARKEAITLQDLLTLTAGLACDNAPLSGMEQSNDWIQFMLDAPMVEQPGTKFNYCGGATHLLSAILQKTTGMSAREFANRFLFEPMGIAGVPENRWEMDAQGISLGPGGLYLTPRDLAKLGYLYLQNGRWGDQQVIPADWVKASTTRHTMKDNGLGYGYLWTIDPDQGSYSALGLAGQQIYVVPSRNLVIVFTATLPSYQPDMDFLPLKALVDTSILPAVKSEQALPANPAAAARVNTFIREAANPKQASSIPEKALQWSGVVYQMEPNPNQWETISFAMQPGADTMTVTFNGQVVDPQVGLDNLYRIQSGTEVFAPQAMRGSWKNESTLFLQVINLGVLNDADLQVIFSTDEVNLTVENIVNGQEMKLRGNRKE